MFGFILRFAPEFNLLNVEDRYILSLKILSLKTASSCINDRGR
jgi:phosphosulfolactate synthase (CoM biosynthesis protein A)